ncbi:MAG: hypothetical protein JNL49_05950 [Bacteroidia bacterium]|nr:hypothetical protein [Bacteroidia bacterium]
MDEIENEEPLYQKLFERLTDPEIRGFLNMEYLKCKGNFQLFYEAVSETFGENAKMHMDLLFMIASKKEFYEYFQEDDEHEEI